MMAARVNPSSESEVIGRTAKRSRKRASLLLVPLLLIGCRSPSAPDPDASVPELFAGTLTPLRKEAPQPPPVRVLTAVRTGAHPGFDRIVFELDGPVPGYRIEYTPGPIRRCGSGEPVAPAGGAALVVRLQPAAAHDEAGRATIEEPARKQPLGLRALREAVLTCDFEAEVAWAIGVAEKRPFRVTELRAPDRLVVDVRHP
jgi:hypothetical protein